MFLDAIVVLFLLGCLVRSGSLPSSELLGKLSECLLRDGGLARGEVQLNELVGGSGWQMAQEFTVASMTEHVHSTCHHLNHFTCDK